MIDNNNNISSSTETLLKPPLSSQTMRQQLVHFRYPLLFIFLLLPLWVFGESSTTTTDTLSQTGSLSDGQTLISLNKTFELGFFSPNGSSNRYVGIWYYKIPDQTPVWVANRNNALLDTSGVLYFNNNGELVIIDGRGSSFIVAYGSGRKDLEATILGSGNLVLREINNVSSIIWQSFDYPTDTWLAGMKLGIVEGQNQLITAWSSYSDPAAGDFSFGLDPNRTSQYFIWQKGTVYWTTGTWSSELGIFRLMPELLSMKNIYLNFVSNSGGMYGTYSINGSYNVRIHISTIGELQILAWVDSVAQWLLFWSQPHENCDVYNVCGAFGLCNAWDLPMCTCVQGFAPASQSDWNNGDTSGGCVRQSTLQCATSRMNITFLATPLKYRPENSKPLNAGSIESCEAFCLSECKCTGYAFSEVCYVWYGDLTNMQLWTIHSNSTELVLYVRENASTIVSSGKNSRGTSKF
jgi:S-locus glycoprotein domain/D-mannose binding lectin/PAN-like domain